MNEILKPQNIQDIFIDSPAGEGIGKIEEERIRAIRINSGKPKEKPVLPNNNVNLLTLAFSEG